MSTSMRTPQPLSYAANSQSVAVRRAAVPGDKRKHEELGANARIDETDGAPDAKRARWHSGSSVASTSTARPPVAPSTTTPQRIPMRDPRYLYSWDGGSDHSEDEDAEDWSLVPVRPRKNADAATHHGDFAIHQSLPRSTASNATTSANSSKDIVLRRGDDNEASLRAGATAAAGVPVIKSQDASTLDAHLSSSPPERVSSTNSASRHAPSAQSLTATLSEKPPSDADQIPTSVSFADILEELPGLARLAAHDPHFEYRARNIDGDRVQCNGCGRWLKLKTWEKHLLDSCRVYVVKPLLPVPAKELVAEAVSPTPKSRTSTPVVKQEYERRATTESVLTPEPEPSPQTLPDDTNISTAAASAADSASESVPSNYRARQGDQVQCDSCGKWMRQIKWEEHSHRSCTRRSSKRAKWFYVETDD